MTKSIFLNQIQTKLLPLKKGDMDSISGGHPGGLETHKLTVVTCNQGHTHYLEDEK